MSWQLKRKIKLLERPRRSIYSNRMVLKPAFFFFKLPYLILQSKFYCPQIKVIPYTLKIRATRKVLPTSSYEYLSAWCASALR